MVEVTHLTAPRLVGILALKLAAVLVSSNGCPIEFEVASHVAIINLSFAVKAQCRSEGERVVAKTACRDASGF